MDTKAMSKIYLNNIFGLVGIFKTGRYYAVCWLMILVSFFGLVTSQTMAAPKVALVLGGGAARGASHIGVIRALNESGIPIDMIVSTSMGSIVGGLYAAGFSTETLNTLVVEVSVVSAAELQFPPTGGLLDARPFEYMMRSLTQNMHLQDTVIPFFPVVTDLASNEPVALTMGDLASAVHASMAIPILFIPVQRDGHYYYDGGLKAAVPVQIARAKGADVVIAVDVTRHIEADPDNILSNFQAIYLDLITGFNDAQLEQANILLDPGLQYDSYMSFDQVAYFEQAGYEATQRRMAELLIVLKEATVPLRPVGDVNAQNPLNESWSERLQEARRQAAERDRPLTVSLDVGLVPSHYQSDYDLPGAAPLSIAKVGFDLSEGVLGDFSVGASLGLSGLYEVASVSLRAGLQPVYAWRFSSELLKEPDHEWELKFGVMYRYSDFDKLDVTTQLLLQAFSGRLEASTHLEIPGLATYVELKLPLSTDYYRTALDVRTTLRWHQVFLHGRGFLGFASEATPLSEQFGFGQPILMRGTPLSAEPSVFVANFELGWQAIVGIPLADAFLLKPLAWGFVDLGYAPSQNNVAIGLGAGVEGLLFGFAPFTIAADLAYGLESDTWTLGLRTEIWPTAYVMMG